ncbi:MAG: helix-turn-helix transcriptional regulator [Bacillota bacterium]|nr:helix-turn-helix transcriptional regulator [Bacillota bacterium]
MSVRLYDHQLKRDLYRRNVTFHKNVKFLRLAHGYSQEEMAKQFHLARSTYNALERGGSPPHFDLALAIADFYNINLDYLISYDITEQLLAMIRPECEDVNALIFIEKWLTLSVSGREQMAGDIRYLYEQEKKYNKFPWKYVDSIFERK